MYRNRPFSPLYLNMTSVSNTTDEFSYEVKSYYEAA
jgi:hypothetical protein